MENETKVVEPQVEPETTPEQKVDETTVEDPRLKELEDKLNKEAEARKQLTARAKKAEEDRKALEAKLKLAEGNTAPLDIEDYIDISASLEGMDQKQKEKLAREHKLTGKPLKEIRDSEDFQLWNDAYTRKLEKERTLKPSNTQEEADRPKSIAEKLRGVSLEEQEKILTEAGLWKSPRPRADRTRIGG